MLSARWKRWVRQRWRKLVTVAAAIACIQFVLSACLAPVGVVSVPGPGGEGDAADAAAVRRLLENGLRDERGAWSCPSNSSESCRLTRSLLETTAAAHPSVYARTGLDCLAMFRGHAGEIEAARALMDRRPSTTSSDEDLRLQAADCAAFRRSRGYFTQPLSADEADFPIAFSILAYDNIPQV